MYTEWCYRESKTRFATTAHNLNLKIPRTNTFFECKIVETYTGGSCFKIYRNRAIDIYMYCSNVLGSESWAITANIYILHFTKLYRVFILSVLTKFRVWWLLWGLNLLSIRINKKPLLKYSPSCSKANYCTMLLSVHCLDNSAYRVYNSVGSTCTLVILWVKTGVGNICGLGHALSMPDCGPQRSRCWPFLKIKK